MSSRDEKLRKLSAYLDGELSDAERDEMDKALENDPELANELAGLKGVRDLLRSMPRETAGERFVDQVIQRAERRDLMAGADDGGRETGGWSWTRMVTGAAVLLIAAGVGVMVAVTLTSSSWMDQAAVRPPLPAGDEIARESTNLAREQKELAETDPPSGETPTAKPAHDPLGYAADSGSGVGRGPNAREDSRPRHRTERDAERAGGGEEQIEAPKDRRAEALAKRGYRSKIAAGSEVETAPESTAAPEARAARHGGFEDGRPTAQPTQPAAPTQDRTTLRVTDGLARSERSTVAEPIEIEPVEMPRPGRRENGKTGMATEQPGVRMAKEGIAGLIDVPALAPEFAAARNEVIYTHDLAGTQREIERVFADNGIVPLVVETPPRQAQVELQQYVGRAGNYVQMTQVEPDQVQYLIYGEPRQNASVVDELRSVRRQQIVSQRSLVLNDTDQQAAPRELPEEMPADGPADRKAETQSAEGSARVEGYVAVEDAPGGALRLRQASSERSTSRGNGGGDDGASLAGANVEPLLVTLNFRPAARPAPRRPVPGRTPATQADSGE